MKFILIMTIVAALFSTSNDDSDKVVTVESVTMMQIEELNLSEADGDQLYSLNVKVLPLIFESQTEEELNAITKYYHSKLLLFLTKKQLKQLEENLPAIII